MRTDSSFIGSAAALESKILYFVRMGSRAGGQDVEILVAKPEGAPAQRLAWLPARRLPPFYMVQPVLSPDGKWLAIWLADGSTSNLYLLPPAGGPLRQMTDFGKRATETPAGSPGPLTRSTFTPR